MTTLYNDIVINAPLDRIWSVLSNVEALDQYDPTVKRSVALLPGKTGLGASRRVDMRDGKNWFEEKVTAFDPNKTLEFELTACSFPVDALKHSYSFEAVGDGIRVKQVMEYRVKFGIFGRWMDALMIRGRSDSGIKSFFKGLKTFVETP